MYTKSTPVYLERGMPNILEAAVQQIRILTKNIPHCNCVQKKYRKGKKRFVRFLRSKMPLGISKLLNTEQDLIDLVKHEKQAECDLILMTKDEESASFVKHVFCTINTAERPA